MPLRFRNIDTTPDAPVREWGFEGMLAALDRNPPARPWVVCSVLCVACGPSFRVVPCRFVVSPVGFVGPCAGSRAVL